MKKIYPTVETNLAKLNSNEKPITQQQYEDLVNRTNTAVACGEAAENAVAQLRADQATSIATAVGNIGTVCSTEVDASYVQAANADIATADITHLTTDDLHADTANITDLRANESILGVASATSVNAPTANINSIQSDSITTCSINANTAEFTTFSADELQADNLTVDCANAANANITNLTADKVESAEFSGNEATFSEVSSENASVACFETNYITHLNNAQEVTENADTGDFYILLPQFTNGNYFVEARNDGGRKLWSFEVLNSVKNIQFRWSEDLLGQIIDIKTVEDASGVMIIQIHANTTFEHVTLYHQSQSTSNTDAPTIYVTDQFPEVDPTLILSERSGTFIQDIIFTNKLHIKELDMDSLFMDCVGVKRELHLTCDFNQAGSILEPITTAGQVGDYVMNESICGYRTPTWVTPADKIRFQDKRLVASGTVASYTGKVESGFLSNTISWEAAYADQTTDWFKDENGTVSLVSITLEDELYTAEWDDGTVTDSAHATSFTYYFATAEGYPIVHLGDNTTVHGSAEVTCNLKVDCGLFTPHFIDSETIPTGTGTALVGQDEDIYRHKEGVLDPIAVKNGAYDEWATHDGKPVIYDATTDSFEPTDELIIDDLEVDNLQVNENAVIGCNLEVGGDLFVKGKTITTEEETVSTSSDMIVLRQNNNTALGTGEASGIIVNKYNGTDNLAIVTDNTGTLRIGDATGTTTSYANIYYKDDKWYSDAEATTEVTPVGELTSWAVKEIVDGVTHYANAIFTAFDYTSLSPVMGRDELAAMTGNALLVWNATTKEANTITVPAVNGASLKYNTTTNTYYWEQSAGVFRFATMAAYEAAASTVPVGSLVLIDEEDNFVKSQEIV